MLDISRGTLYRKIVEYQLEPSTPRRRARETHRSIIPWHLAPRRCI